jgi:alpha-acetolactate decarboxylase
MVSEQGSEQTPCGDNMVLVGFFPKIFQRVQRRGTFLNFVEDDQRFPGSIF